MIDRVHRSHDGQQNLRGADIRRSLVATNMLFASAEGEAQGRVAMDILGYANQATGHLAFVFILGR